MEPFSLTGTPSDKKKTSRRQEAAWDEEKLRAALSDRGGLPADGNPGQGPLGRRAEAGFHNGDNSPVKMLFLE
ncbi:hypothetical protein D3C81_2131680 [compost metagenome]